MRFLLKAAFWLTIVLILIPSGEKGERLSAAQPQVGATEALGAASSAIADLRDICTRKPDVCDVGSQVAVTLGQKAQAGAKMLYDFLTEKLNKPAGEAARPVESSVAGRTPSQNTLVPTDLAPVWRRPDRPDPKPERAI